VTGGGRFKRQMGGCRVQTPEACVGCRRKGGVRVHHLEEVCRASITGSMVRSDSKQTEKIDSRARDCREQAFFVGPADDSDIVLASLNVPAAKPVPGPPQSFALVGCARSFPRMPVIPRARRSMGPARNVKG
jgi:hypothetical protein